MLKTSPQKSPRGNYIWVFFLMAISSFLIWDILIDYKQTGQNLHIYLEIALCSISIMFGAYIIWRLTFTEKMLLRTKHALRQKTSDAERWEKAVIQASQNIESATRQQFEIWQLSESEREIAKLLIKGKSFKEIAVLRFTQEKTARAQASKIYQKSGLSSRPMFTAFFLDILFPND